MLVTKRDMDYRVAPYGNVGVIPKGVEVEPADNIPGAFYWCKPWQGMTRSEASWHHNYGFLVRSDEVEHVKS